MSLIKKHIDHNTINILVDSSYQPQHPMFQNAESRLKMAVKKTRLQKLYTNITERLPGRNGGVRLSQIGRKFKPLNNDVIELWENMNTQGLTTQEAFVNKFLSYPNIKDLETYFLMGYSSKMIERTKRRLKNNIIAHLKK